MNEGATGVYEGRFEILQRGVDRGRETAPGGLGRAKHGLGRGCQKRSGWTDWDELVVVCVKDLTLSHGRGTVLSSPTVEQRKERRKEQRFPLLGWMGVTGGCACPCPWMLECPFRCYGSVQEIQYQWCTSLP